jgi:hypothetical protein
MEKTRQYKTRQNNTDEVTRRMTSDASTIPASKTMEDAIGHVTRAFSRKNLQAKWRGTRPGRRLRASLRNRNAIGNVTKASVCENLYIECRRPTAQHRLCASRRMEMAQKPLCAKKNTGKTPRAKSATQTLREPAQSKCT